MRQLSKSLGLSLGLCLAGAPGCFDEKLDLPELQNPTGFGGMPLPMAGAPSAGAGVTPNGGVGGSPANVAGTAGAGGSAGGSGGIGGVSGSAGASGASAGAPCAAGNVCDGFEGADFGAWLKNGDGGTIELDQTHVFNGQQAVRFVSEPGGSKRTQLERTGAPLFPAMGNVFWGRVMAYANELPFMSDMEDKNVHYDLIQASGQQPGEYRVAGMGGVLLNYEPHDCYFGTQKPIPEDRWACWEWLFDGENNVIEFYIDGVQQARIENKGQGCVDNTDSVWEAPTFNELRIGWVNYQSKAETTTLWLDEFAAGPQRVGCLDATAATH